MTKTFITQDGNTYHDLRGTSGQHYRYNAWGPCATREQCEAGLREALASGEITPDTNPQIEETTNRTMGRCWYVSCEGK